MRDIVALVFGGEQREECEPDAHVCGRRNAPDAQWCQTSPGREELAGLGLAHAPAGSRRGDRRHGPFGIKIL
jgi:hypothetical protein